MSALVGVGRNRADVGQQRTSVQLLPILLCPLLCFFPFLLGVGSTFWAMTKVS